MLKRLEVNALRGSTGKLLLDFEKGKKIVIIYGQNGSGKSTICDAVELLCKGKVGSLEGKGLGKTEAYWHSTSKTPLDLSVSLITTKGEWQAKVSKARPVVTPNNLPLRAEVLRRSQIQKLIADQPKTRFDAIRPFLDTESVELSENKLRKLIDQEKANRETAVARIEENRVAVENFWKEGSCPSEGALPWARKEVERGSSQMLDEISRLELLITQIEDASREETRLGQCREDFVKAEEAHNIVKQRLAEEQAKISKDVGDLIDILEAAQRYFTDRGELDACPLCGSTEFVQGLPARVADQLNAVRSLSQASKSKEDSEGKVADAESQFKKQSQHYLIACQQLATSIETVALPEDLVWPRDVLDAKKAFAKGDNEIDAQLSLAGHLVSRAMNLRDVLKPFSEKQKEKRGFIQTLKRAVETYDSNYAAQEELDMLIPRMEKALSEIEEERRQFVGGVLKNISSRVGDLYERIHVGEGLSKISLLLDPDKRASLEILCPFPGVKDVPPGAYLSDSHLDTLGLCIWLAIAELGDASNTILVLDDAVMSVDEPHVERVIELLYELGTQFYHCIYTTHYQPWREKYRWGWLRNGECQFIELAPWEHANGIRQTKHLPKVDELRALLSGEPLMIQPICASAAVILEAILHFLTQLFECSVPIRKGKLTLGDLLPSIKGRLRNALKIESQEKDDGETKIFREYPLGPILDELQRIFQARNVLGCHFNELAYQLPEEDALRFANAVLVLADLLIDPDCGWPRSDKSGSYWVNSKETRRLHPLKQPA